jgi:hypothetical protein
MWQDLIYKAWPLLLSTMLYTAQGIIFLKNNNPGMGLAFFGYAFANIGLIWAAIL